MHVRACTYCTYIYIYIYISPAKWEQYGPGFEGLGKRYAALEFVPIENSCFLAKFQSLWRLVTVDPSSTPLVNLNLLSPSAYPQLCKFARRFQAHGINLLQSYLGVRVQNLMCIGVALPHSAPTNSITGSSVPRTAMLSLLRPSPR